MAKGKGQRAKGKGRTAKPAKQFEVGTIRPTSGHFRRRVVSAAPANRQAKRELHRQRRLAVGSQPRLSFVSEFFLIDAASKSSSRARDYPERFL